MKVSEAKDWLREHGSAAGVQAGRVEDYLAGRSAQARWLRGAVEGEKGG